VVVAESPKDEAAVALRYRLIPFLVWPAALGGGFGSAVPDAAPRLPTR
jgi:hypothetical protein